MTIDGIILRAITNELKEKLINGRIQKINQINKNLMILGIYADKNYKLLISSNSQAPRIHITEKDFLNPQTPSNFTMILRKHLMNSKLIDIKQNGMDRTIELVFDSRNELGLMVKRKIILDLMGKHSNVVLINEEDTVIEAITRVSHDMSRVRAIYPGSKFDSLESDKIDISQKIKDLSEIEIPDSMEIFKIFYTNYQGFSPTIGREISYLSDLAPKRSYGSLTAEEKENLNKIFLSICTRILDNNFRPNLIYQDEKLKDFYCFELKHLTKIADYYESISKVLDDYYIEIADDDSLSQAKNNLKTSITKLISKRITKLDYLKADLKEASNYDNYRIEGELLQANIHALKRGMKAIKVFNYYDNKDQDINLDNRKDGWQNVEQKYKLAKKYKKSYSMLNDSIPNLEDELLYLRTILIQLDSIDDKLELQEVRQELYDGNYIRSIGKNKSKKKIESSKPHRYLTSDGSTILVGKNNKQNEQITLKEANKEDYFFHVKNLPGSHVILKNDTFSFSEEDLLKAAYLAASFSKYSDDKYLDVDYTKRKNVFKNKAAKPGMVYYNDFNTIRVNLEDKIHGLEKIK